MKKLDILIIKSFIGPFVATFFISLFLFLMHFLWKYIDDLVGKGLELTVIAKLIGFSLADLVPMALPLAVMISSLMTYGNLSESYEMVAIKSAGVSLYRALLPVFGVMVILSILTFYFSNVVIPRANLEAKSLLYDVRQKKPAFNIKEDVFYNEIDGYSIKVGKKYEDNERVEDILIYEQPSGQHALNVLKAKSGQMKLSADKRILYFTLNDGIRYQEMNDQPNYFKTYPANIMRFKKQKITFDLSALDLQLTEKEAFKGDQRMMNINELQENMDSAIRARNRYVGYLGEFIAPYLHLKDTSGKSMAPAISQNDILLNFPVADQPRILEQAMNQVRIMKSTVQAQMENMENYEKDLTRFQAEWHKKFTLSVIVILLFLISAPLGTIIRRGGIGMPLVISVLMFVVYYVVNLTGEKIGKEGILPLWGGMWLSTFFLLPIGLFLTYKSARDAAFLNIDTYIRFFRRLIPRKIRDTEGIMEAKDAPKNTDAA